MIGELIVFLEETLLPLGPFGVFSASFIEEVIAPIPSAVVMLTGGFLYVTGESWVAVIGDILYFVAIPAALGVSLGSLVVYGIARYIGIDALVTWGKVFGIRHEDGERARAYFNESKKDEILVFVARVIPVIPASLIALGAGLIEMPVKRYLIISVVGTLIRASILGFIGWQVGEVYVAYAHIIDEFENYILMALGTICLGSLLYIRYKRK